MQFYSPIYSGLTTVKDKVLIFLCLCALASVALPDQLSQVPAVAKNKDSQAPPVPVLAIAKIKPRTNEPLNLTAKQTTEIATNVVLEVLRANMDLAKTDEQAFFQLIDVVFTPYVDFRRMIRSIMATHYKSTNKEQRKRFVNNFKWSLIRAYASTLLLADLNSIVIGKDYSPTNKGRRNRVEMSVQSKKGYQFNINFSLVKNKDKKWYLANLIVNGINLGLIYRQQFNTEMTGGKHRNNLNAVIDNWIQDKFIADLTPKE